MIVLDCANALYSKTGYFDKESNAVMSDDFQLVRLFQEIIGGGVKPKNTAIVCSFDHSLTQVKSVYLNNLLESVEPFNNVNGEFTTKKYIDVKHDGNNAILHPKIDAKSHDEYCQSKKYVKLPPRNMVKIQIPRYTLKETEVMVNYYNASGITFGRTLLIYFSECYQGSCC